MPAATSERVPGSDRARPAHGGDVGDHRDRSATALIRFSEGPGGYRSRNHAIPFPTPVLGGKGNPTHRITTWRVIETVIDRIVLPSLFWEILTAMELLSPAMKRGRMFSRHRSGSASTTWLIQGTVLPRACSNSNRRCRSNRITLSCRSTSATISLRHSMRRNGIPQSVRWPHLICSARAESKRQRAHYISAGTSCIWRTSQQNDPSGYVTRLKTWLSLHSRLYGLMRAARNVVRPPVPP